MIGGVDSNTLKSTYDEDGLKWYLLKLTLTIRLSDEVGLLVCRILHRGKEVGKADIAYSFT